MVETQEKRKKHLNSFLSPLFSSQGKIMSRHQSLSELPYQLHTHAIQKANTCTTVICLVLLKTSDWKPGVVGAFAAPSTQKETLENLCKFKANYRGSSKTTLSQKNNQAETNQGWKTLACMY